MGRLFRLPETAEMNRTIPIFNKIVNFPGKKARGYEIKAKKSKEAEIWIYEEIGDSWFGGISASQFSKDMKAYADTEKITVRINSPGGDVFDGIAIYNILKQHKAKVEVHIDGLAASIASVIAMAGDTIHIAENAMMMIHEAWTVVAGSSGMLREAADMLEKVNGQIVKTYMTRASVEEQQIIDLMAAETWMTAEEAVEYGLADQMSESLDMAACFDLSKFKYRNAPAVDVPQGEPAIRQKLASMSMASRRIKAALTK